jgi:oxygen-independent coproporphyrinogen-3 oxidase
MVGETTENWRECVRKTIEMAPDSVTIYQMEVPHNTTLFKEMKVFGEPVAPVASWPAKREWVNYAFSEFERAGYTIASAYTAVKDAARTKFLYRDMLWAGADLLGLGVASFSHVQGTHFQNEHEIGAYQERIGRGELPVFRALTPTADERLIRELVLQMKLGSIRTAYFRDKFGVDVRERFALPFEQLSGEGMLAADGEGVRLSREGLLRVDSLLPSFFRPEHRVGRRV